MRTFKDNSGREWTISVNVGSVKRVRDLTQVNLYDIGDVKLAEELASNIEMVVNIIYALIKPDADAKGITDEQFGAAMAGDAIDAAINAFTEDLIDFFPKHRRQLLQAAAKKSGQLREQLLVMATAKIEGISADDLLREMQNKTYTSSPESSASTPQT